MYTPLKDRANADLAVELNALMWRASDIVFQLIKNGTISAHDEMRDIEQLIHFTTDLHVELNNTNYDNSITQLLDYQDKHNL